MLLEVPCTMKKMLMILDEQNEFFVNVHCIGQISQPPVAWLLWLMTFSLFGARWVKAMGDVKDMEHFSIMCNVVKKLRETKQKGLGGVGYVMIKEVVL